MCSSHLCVIILIIGHTKTVTFVADDIIKLEDKINPFVYGCCSATHTSLQRVQIRCFKRDFLENILEFSLTILYTVLPYDSHLRVESAIPIFISKVTYLDYELFTICLVSNEFYDSIISKSSLNHGPMPNPFLRVIFPDI